MVLRILLLAFVFCVRDFHPLWSDFPDLSTSTWQTRWSPTTPENMFSGLGFSAFARHYSQNLLFSSGYLDVSVLPVPFPFGMTRFYPCRVSPFGYLRLFSAAHASSELFAVYHVLHRHLMPRHPPYALIRFSYVIRRDGISHVHLASLLTFYALLALYVIVKVLGQSSQIAFLRLLRKPKDDFFSPPFFGSSPIRR